MTFVCAGLSPLLNLCASGLVPKNRPIHYLDYENTYDPSRFTSSIPHTSDFIVGLSQLFDIEIIHHGPLKWYCPPPAERTPVNCISWEEPPITLEPENTVSLNSTLFLSELLKGTSVDIFPEGSSCFGPFTRPTFTSEFFKLRIRSQFDRLLRRLLKKPYYLSNLWLLPDYDGIIENRFVTHSFYQVLSTHKFFSSLASAASFFASRYPSIDFRHISFPVFHPVIENLSSPQYSIYLAHPLIDSAQTVIVKNKPRDLISAIDSLSSNIVSIPQSYRWLPAELITLQTPMHYFGSYSTVLLSFPRHRISICQPPDLLLSSQNRYYNSGLISLLNL